MARNQEGSAQIDERLKNREIVSHIRKCLTEVCGEGAATARPNIHCLDEHLWFSLCAGVQGMELFAEFFCWHACDCIHLASLAHLNGPPSLAWQKHQTKCVSLTQATWFALFFVQQRMHLALLTLPAMGFSVQKRTSDSDLRKPS